MRSLLQCQKTHPELRGKLRGLVSALLLRAGTAVLEPLALVRTWAAGVTQPPAASIAAVGTTASNVATVLSEPSVLSSTAAQSTQAVTPAPTAASVPPPPGVPPAAAVPAIWVALLLFVKCDVPHALELLTHLPQGYLAVLLTGSPRETLLRDRFRAWFVT